MRSRSLPPDSASPQGWALVASPATAARLAPLIAAHLQRRPVYLLRSRVELDAVVSGCAAMLICDDDPRGPAALRSTFHFDNVREVPCGWLPVIDGLNLTRYGIAAATALERTPSRTRRGPAILLGEFAPRALATVATVQGILPAEWNALRWTAERITRTDLLAALGAGPGLAIYFGHGDTRGWVGYGGCGRADLATFRGEPLGVLLSLTCASATRPPDDLSFCEAVVCGGLAMAAVGAIAPTDHAENVELGHGLARALHDTRITTLADLLIAPEVPRTALRHYRIIGDPLVPLDGLHDAHERCRAVFAPAADDPLPTISLSAWE
jgi:hypothetical protein